MAENPVNGSNCRVDPGSAKSNNHPGSNSEGNCPYGNENADFSYTVLKYINDVLMEEDVEGRPCMLQDCLALQAAEKAFYDVLTQKYPSSPPHFHHNLQVPNKSTWHYDPHDDFDSLEERRKNKHLAMAVEGSSEEHMFDEVFLVKTGNGVSMSCPLYEGYQNREANSKLEDNGEVKRNNRKRIPAKKQAGNGKEMVDLGSLLTQCVQAVAVYDQRIATELLGKIGYYSSPYGDGTERLAHYFAKGLEIRLNGTRAPLFTQIPSNTTLATDVLKSHILHVSVFPFGRISNLFSNRNIAKLAEKATTVHVIDFGIAYERIEATGRRLRRYCENVNVPFEFNAIAKRWETIRAEELNIEKDELLVVNCMYRLRNLPDDSVTLNSPRNMVLKLIKRLNPDLFIQGVVNGNYNFPFFINRFREAFFHFSAMFDVLEANVGGEDPDRLLLERETFGRDAINVIAYEGMERSDRSETYKQWQLRNQKAGFRQLSLEQNMLNRARTVLKSDYHKDFDIEVDGKWMLQGWKGRVIHALSCWKPVQD
ncbi:hypothetical protein Gorai_011501 [Gossypium raimondii]|uniref:GRAS family transcription factor n=2 Tax=Gossypium raimondii TaxID=29730 RepID=A0A7J8PZ80_GOSRA|nr:hypothetical protein [Gossypium raimondii]